MINYKYQNTYNIRQIAPLILYHLYLWTFTFIVSTGVCGANNYSESMIVCILWEPGGSFPTLLHDIGSYKDALMLMPSVTVTFVNVGF